MFDAQSIYYIYTQFTKNSLREAPVSLNVLFSSTKAKELKNLEPPDSLLCNKDKLLRKIFLSWSWEFIQMKFSWIILFLFFGRPHVALIISYILRTYLHQTAQLNWS